ncbi:MAG: hypothetical protein EBQ97_04950, partial [Bacteroidetes bacterium]|nr:hypothetical protein [Bacteroidota bacterium]
MHRRTTKLEQNLSTLLTTYKMNMSRLRHISIFGITTLTILVALCNFSNPLQAQKDGPSEAQIRKQMESDLKFTPYSRTAPVKPNVFGNYPKLNNV